MASGSSGLVNSGSKGFDFPADDILLSHENYGYQDSYKHPHLDSGTGAANASQEFHKTRMARSSVFSPTSHGLPEDSFSEDMTSVVERGMKKYADNMMRFLEGISSRLSQLELYCYNLDKTMGEMRSDLTHDHGEADAKLKTVEKYLQEIHRSVHLLRDKQEVTEAQKELAKLHFTHKDSISPTHSQSNDGRASSPASTDNRSDVHNQHLALALHHQVAPQHQPQSQHQPQQQPQLVPQEMHQQPPPPYYMPTPSQPTNPPPPCSVPAGASPPESVQCQYLPPKLTQPHSSLAPQTQPFAQYQQVWTQQLSHSVQPQQQTSVRLSATGPYPPYTLTQQQTNPSRPPTDTLSSSMPIHVSYSGVPQQPIQAPPSRTTPQQSQPQQFKSSYVSTQPGDVYPVSGTHLSVLPPPGSYTMLENSEAGRSYYPPQQIHFHPTPYIPQQSIAASNSSVCNSGPPPQYTRNHQYDDLIYKLGNMGFRGDHVLGVIQRMEETGQQPIDFNSVFDRLNGQSPVVPQRGW